MLPSYNEDAMDVLQAMKHMEQSYCYDAFFRRAKLGSLARPHVNASWREKICQWSYDVVDHFGFSREVVAISLDLFDRYLATQGNECTGNEVLLISLTTLHIAVKIHETKKIKITTLTSLSRGSFGRCHMQETERRIFAALGWKLNAPTPFAFCAEMLKLLPDDEILDETMRMELLERSRFLTELAVCDSALVTCKKSMVALASILNALQDMNLLTLLPPDVVDLFVDNIIESTGLHCSSVTAVRQRLSLAYEVMMSGSNSSADESYFSDNTSNKREHSLTRTVSWFSETSSGDDDLHPQDNYRYDRVEGTKTNKRRRHFHPADGSCNVPQVSPVAIN